MRFRVIQFFVTTIGLTWLSFIPFATLQWSAGEFPKNLLFAAGGLGPLTASFIMVRSSGDRGYMREYLSRIFSPRRIPPGWWCAIVLLPPAVTSAGILLGTVLTGSRVTSASLLNMDIVARITPFYILLMLLAPIFEEIAWRGYGLDSLQSRFRPAAASLILAFVWWGWHLPLFFMADTYQSQLGLFTTQSLEFLVWLVAATFIMTWIYNGTSGSILAAIIFHFVMNLSNELLVTTLAAEIARSGILVALAVFIFAILPRVRRGPHTAVDRVWRPLTES